MSLTRISKRAIYFRLSTGSYTPVRGQAPGRIQSLRAFRRTAPRLSVVGRCSVLEAVGAVRRVAMLSGPLESTAHSRRSHRGHRAAWKSHRSGVICNRRVWFWSPPVYTNWCLPGRAGMRTDSRKTATEQLQNPTVAG